MQDQQEFVNYESEPPKIPYAYDNDGRFFLPISNTIQRTCYNQYTYHPPQFLIMPQMPVQPCPQAPQKKAKKTNTKEVENLRARIMELEMRKPEVQIVKEVEQVIDTEQISKLERDLRMIRLQLEHEIENGAQKDRIISDLKAQIQKNDLSRSSSLVSLQTQIVERERQITKQDQQITQLNAEIQQLQYELEDAHRHIEELQSTHEEVTVEKMTYLSNEVEVWKRKFQSQNREFHDVQERLMMLEAELESIKKGDVKEVKQIVVEKKDNIGRIVDVTRSEQVEIRKSGYLQNLKQ